MGLVQTLAADTDSPLVKNSLNTALGVPCAPAQPRSARRREGIGCNVGTSCRSISGPLVAPNTGTRGIRRISDLTGHHLLVHPAESWVRRQSGRRGKGHGHSQARWNRRGNLRHARALHAAVLTSSKPAGGSHRQSCASFVVREVKL